ncbi:MAG: YicC/YloC family endoribonuclease [Candidatus Zhuqueibacterota bacterium]
MTGFGRGEVRKNGYEILTEVRSVNNRFLDIQVKLPKNFYHFEHEAKALVRDYISRGRLNLIVSLNGYTDQNNYGLMINSALATSYVKLIRQLKRDLKISGKVRLEHVLSFPEIISYEDDSHGSDEVWSAIEEAIKSSLENLQQMRSKEGDELANDLIQRINMLDQEIGLIEQISEQRFEEELTKLRKRIQEITENHELDETRLETEVALIINRMDVTEECVRFKSHNKLFLKTLEAEDAVGRKLNFLLQEMTREANTIGAKVNNAEIAHLVVEIKEEVEKIREQVQNIE